MQMQEDQGNGEGQPEVAGSESGPAADQDQRQRDHELGPVGDTSFGQPGFSQPSGLSYPSTANQPGFSQPSPASYPSASGQLGAPDHPSAPSQPGAGGYPSPYGQPSGLNHPSATGHPGYGQPDTAGHPGAYGQPGGASYPGAGQAGYGQSGYGPPGAGGYPGPYGQPGGAGYPVAGQPGYGQPGYGQPGYGPPGAGGYPGPYGPPGAGGFGPPGPPAWGQPGGYPPPDPRRRRRRSLITYLTVAAVAAAAGAGAVLTLSHNPAANNTTSHGSTSHGVGSTSVRAVINAVQPGLVDISSELGYEGGAAAATGMVISSNGLVLTNNHVITATTGLVATVVTTGQRFRAKWLGYDSSADVAVIQLINASGLKTIPIGNSATVRVGDNVVALGNANGAGGAPAVAGSITGLNRTITASDSGAGTSETLHGMLQTNAGIVPGDSGGALATTAGLVIGMNTAAATGSFDNPGQSVGFAIPINRALTIAREIIKGQASPTVRIGATGFMGVLVPAHQASLSTSPREQRRLQLQQDQAGSAFPVPNAGPACLANDQSSGIPAHVAPASTGALIIGRLCGTPADRAGLVAGDVITGVGSHRVTSPSQLTTVMLGFKPGVAVQIIWMDINGQSHHSTLVLAQDPPA